MLSPTLTHSHPSILFSAIIVERESNCNREINMAASSSSLLPSLLSIKARGSYLKGCNNIRRGLQVLNVQNYQDADGRSINMGDANLNVLKERIEMVRVKERLERCCKCQHGWNYYPVPNNHHKIKRRREFMNSLIELTCLVCGTLGFTCLGGTLFLCLISLLVHLQL